MYYYYVNHEPSTLGSIIVLIAFIWYCIHFYSKRAKERKEEEELQRNHQMYIVPIKKANGKIIRVPMTLNEIYQKGMEYLRGDGVEHNEEKALKWLHIAAKRGHRNAILTLKAYKRATAIAPRRHS